MTNTPESKTPEPYRITKHEAMGETWFNVFTYSKISESLGTFNRLENAELFMKALIDKAAIREAQSNGGTWEQIADEIVIKCYESVIANAIQREREARSNGGKI